MGTVVFWVWKVHLRVQFPICILEAPVLSPDLEIYCPGKWFSLVSSDLPGKCWRGTSTWTMTIFFSPYNLFFTLSYHQSMLSYGLHSYLNHKRTQTTRTFLTILTYRMQQWQVIRNFVRLVSSWRTSACAARKAIHPYYTECYKNASVKVAL
jgi:hypothetical protein